MSDSGNSVVSLGCKGCGTCIQVCPTNALITNGGKVVRVDMEKCTLCMECIRACSNKALFLMD